jgi:hypothetical protein
MRGGRIVSLGKYNKKAQTWSVDLVLGVVIFLLIVVIIYSLIASKPSKETQLRDDADKIYLYLNENENNKNIPHLINGSTISEDELSELYNTSYEQLKSELGINSDFCIVVISENNAIVTVDGKTSIGNGKDVLIGPNTYCGET